MNPNIEKLRKQNEQWRKPSCFIMFVTLWLLLGAGLYILKSNNKTLKDSFPEPYGELIEGISRGTSAMMLFSMALGVTIGIYFTRRFSPNTIDLLVQLHDDVEALKKRTTK